LVMDHSELDKLLSNLCHKVGVNIVLNHKTSSLPENFDKIIGCDGAESFTRKYLKEKEPTLRLGIQGFVPTINSKESFVEAWPCKNGFLWKIPRGNEIEYGIITDINNAHKTFVEFMKKGNISITNVKAKLIPQGLIIPNNDKITLCGDSAGLTKPWSGGGVIWGFKAADILLENFPSFKNYRKKAKGFFIKKILLSKVFVRLIYFIGFSVPWLMPENAKVESDFLF